MHFEPVLANLKKNVKQDTFLGKFLSLSLTTALDSLYLASADLIQICGNHANNNLHK